MLAILVTLHVPTFQKEVCGPHTSKDVADPHSTMLSGKTPNQLPLRGLLYYMLTWHLPYNS